MIARPSWCRPRWIVLALIVAAIYCIEPRVGIQMTESVPFHQYLIVDGVPKKGDYVDVVMRQPLIDPHKPVTLTKRVVCTPGELLVFRDGAHYCNGEALGKVVAKTLRGERLAPFVWDGPVPPGKLFLAGSHPRSFDSRYFGFVDQSRVRKIWPLF